MFLWTFLCFALVFPFIVFADADEPVLLDVPDNMGFETVAVADSVPFNWDCLDIVCVTDSMVHRGGSFSARLTGDPSGAEGYLQRIHYMGYQGEELSFTGWVLGDGSSSSSVGAWLAVLDTGGNLLGFDEYEFPATPGTSWESFSVAVPKSAFADSVEFGVWISGSGTIWADDFQLLLDGRNLAECPLRGPFGAVSDREFDSGSGIEFGSLSSFQMESLVILGKVWAFLKYHHPYVCSGAVNWDFQLFRVLPAVLAASDSPSREAALMSLFPSVEALPQRELTELPDDSVRMRGDFSWIDGSKIGNSLAYLLNSVLAGRDQGESYYLRDGFLPVFFENDYSLPAYPDDGYRLLALYRFWGLVEYWFPYRYATDTPWSQQLALNLPFFVNAGSALEYQLAVKRLMASVNDTHCGMFNEPEGISSFYGRLHVPIQLAYVQGQWVIDGFSHASMAQTPLRRGDVIISVDGESISAIADRLLPYTRGSNLPAARFILSRYLLRGDTSTADVVIQRGGQEFELNVARMPGDSLNRSLLSSPAFGEDAFSIMDSGFGFIDLASLSAADVDVVRETFTELPGIVIDLRGYPTDDVLYDMAEFLIPESTVFCVVSRSDVDNPGTFFMSESLYAGGGADESYAGPVALLVDEGSMSSSEFHAMAWRQAPGCMVFGSATNGADGNVNRFTLPGGIRTAFSGIGIYNPDGSETQRVGIQPDFLIAPTVDGLQAGEDEVLEAAVAWLESVQTVR